MTGWWRRLVGALAAPARTGLGFQLVVLGTALTALIVGSALLAIRMEIGASTKRLFTAELQRSQSALVALQHRSIEQLLASSALMTQNPTLRAAMETYRIESAVDRRSRPELVATIRREVEKIGAGLGRDLLVVTDDRGRVLAATDRNGTAPRVGDDFSSLPAVRRALDPPQGDAAASLGVARLRGVDFTVGCVPIVLQDYPIGALLVGDRLDAPHLARLRTMFDADVVVTTPDTVLATTLSAAGPPAPTAHPVPDALNHLSAEGTVQIGAGEYAVAALPLGADGTGRPVTLHLLHSITDTLGPLSLALRNTFFLYGIIAVAAAGLGAVTVARSALRPLESFVRFVRSVAATGDYARRFDAGDATREIRILNESYDHLITSLARQHTQLQQRSVELSIANVELRDQMVERERAEQALKQSEEWLRQSQKLEAIGRLAGGVAHDFNNLLTLILSYTELARRECEPGSAMGADLDQVVEAGRRAGALTQQLLAFSRKQVLQPKVLDLRAVVDGIEPMLRRLVGEDVELRTLPHGPLARVKADPSQVEQVLMNLAANARDALPRGGTITIETGNVVIDEAAARRLGPMTPGPWVLLAVRDTGVGMDPATQARIFEPFFTTKEPGKGTGLGLATVYGIVKQSGGFVWVESTPGQGSVFRVYLPPVDEAMTPAVAPAERHPAPRGTETILVVEDQDPVRALAERCLRAQGYSVLVASGGNDALTLADRHPGTIHLLVTDVVMPQMSGLELAAALAARRPDIRILYMSGYPQGSRTDEGVLSSAELLQKPFVPDDLIRRVRAVLDAA
ncbi:MAG TPA: ATP-binding protein [Gemmatimonadales bacterium]|nr:ATP-binding protein [Gemmatimonadales bacterium]